MLYSKVNNDINNPNFENKLARYLLSVLMNLLNGLIPRPKKSNKKVLQAF